MILLPGYIGESCCSESCTQTVTYDIEVFPGGGGDTYAQVSGSFAVNESPHYDSFYNPSGGYLSVAFDLSCVCCKWKLTMDVCYQDPGSDEGVIEVWEAEFFPGNDRCPAAGEVPLSVTNGNGGQLIVTVTVS